MFIVVYYFSIKLSTYVGSATMWTCFLKKAQIQGNKATRSKFGQTDLTIPINIYKEEPNCHSETGLIKQLGMLICILLVKGRHNM